MAAKIPSDVPVLQTAWFLRLYLARAGAVANFVTHILMTQLTQLRQPTIESRIRELQNSFKCLAVVILVF